MTVRLNGRPVELPDQATVATALATLEVDRPTRGVAVAVDAEIVPRGEWERRRLTEGSQVEVVAAIQGG